MSLFQASLGVYLRRGSLQRPLVLLFLLVLWAVTVTGLVIPAESWAWHEIATLALLFPAFLGFLLLGNTLKHLQLSNLAQVAPGFRPIQTRVFRFVLLLLTLLPAVLVTLLGADPLYSLALFVSAASGGMLLACSSLIVALFLGWAFLILFTSLMLGSPTSQGSAVVLAIAGLILWGMLRLLLARAAEQPFRRFTLQWMAIELAAFWELEGLDLLPRVTSSKVAISAELGRSSRSFSPGQSFTLGNLIGGCADVPWRDRPGHNEGHTRSDCRRILSTHFHRSIAPGSCHDSGCWKIRISVVEGSAGRPVLLADNRSQPSACFFPTLSVERSDLSLRSLVVSAVGHPPVLLDSPGRSRRRAGSHFGRHVVAGAWNAGEARQLGTDPSCVVLTGPDLGRSGDG